MIKSMLFLKAEKRVDLRNFNLLIERLHAQGFHDQRWIAGGDQVAWIHQANGIKYIFNLAK